MASYSSQLKEQAVHPLMPPNSQTVSIVSQDQVFLVQPCMQAGQPNCRRPH